MQTFLYFLTAYLLGSIPTGYLASRVMGKPDIFAPGEWGPRPAGEVFQILGTPVGLLVTALDILKGVLVVGPLLNYFNGALPLWQIPWWVISIAGLLVVMGHCHSIWLGFRGGRGLATSFGVVLVLVPVPALGAFVFWACTSFWGLSTRPGALSSAGVLPLLTIPWVWWNHEKMDLVYPVAFLSLWSMFEYRQSLRNFLGMKEDPKEPEASVPPAPEESQPPLGKG